jgi:hypothetical protein
VWEQSVHAGAAGVFVGVKEPADKQTPWSYPPPQEAKDQLSAAEQIPAIGKVLPTGERRRADIEDVLDSPWQHVPGGPIGGAKARRSLDYRLCASVVAQA